MHSAHWIGSIESRSDLISFLHALRWNLARDPSSWHNVELESYLNAIAEFVNDMDENARVDSEIHTGQLTWRQVAEIFNAASTYRQELTNN